MGHALKTFFAVLGELLLVFLVLLVGVEIVLHFFAGEPKVSISVIVALVGTAGFFAWTTYRKSTRVV